MLPECPRAHTCPELPEASPPFQVPHWSQAGRHGHLPPLHPELLRAGPRPSRSGPAESSLRASDARPGPPALCRALPQKVCGRGRGPCAHYLVACRGSPGTRSRGCLLHWRPTAAPSCPSQSHGIKVWGTRSRVCSAMFNVPAGLAPGPADPGKVSASKPQAAWAELPALCGRRRQGLVTLGLCSVSHMMSFPEPAGSGTGLSPALPGTGPGPLGSLASLTSVFRMKTGAFQRVMTQTK